MRVFRGPIRAFLGVVFAVLIQTTLFGRVRLAGLAPDVVMIAVILAGLRLRGEQALIVGFLGGLLFDALSANALGLRAFVYTAVAYLAVRTRDRADVGSVVVAVWVALLSVAGVLLLVTVGTLFGQFEMSGGEAMRRVLLIPVFNFLTALLLSPLSARLLRPTRWGTA